MTAKIQISTEDFTKLINEGVISFVNNNIDENLLTVNVFPPIQTYFLDLDDWIELDVVCLEIFTALARHGVGFKYIP